MAPACVQELPFLGMLFLHGPSVHGRHFHSVHIVCASALHIGGAAMRGLCVAAAGLAFGRAQACIQVCNTVSIKQLQWYLCLVHESVHPAGLVWHALLSSHLPQVHACLLVCCCHPRLSLKLSWGVAFVALSVLCISVFAMHSWLCTAPPM